MATSNLSPPFNGVSPHGGASKRGRKSRRVIVTGADPLSDREDVAPGRAVPHVTTAAARELPHDRGAAARRSQAHTLGRYGKIDFSLKAHTTQRGPRHRKMSTKVDTHRDKAAFKQHDRDKTMRSKARALESSRFVRTSQNPTKALEELKPAERLRRVHQRLKAKREFAPVRVAIDAGIASKDLQAMSKFSANPAAMLQRVDDALIKVSAVEVGLAVDYYPLIGKALMGELVGNPSGKATASSIVKNPEFFSVVGNTAQMLPGFTEAAIAVAERRAASKSTVKWHEWADRFAIRGPRDYRKLPGPLAKSLVAMLGMTLVPGASAMITPSTNQIALGLLSLIWANFLALFFRAEEIAAACFEAVIAHPAIGLRACMVIYIVVSAIRALLRKNNRPHAIVKIMAAIPALWVLSADDSLPSALHFQAKLAAYAWLSAAVLWFRVVPFMRYRWPWCKFVLFAAPICYLTMRESVVRRLMNPADLAFFDDHYLYLVFVALSAVWFSSVTAHFVVTVYLFVSYFYTSLLLPLLSWRTFYWMPFDVHELWYFLYELSPFSYHFTLGLAVAVKCVSVWSYLLAAVILFSTGFRVACASAWNGWLRVGCTACVCTMGYVCLLEARETPVWFYSALWPHIGVVSAIVSLLVFTRRRKLLPILLFLYASYGTYCAVADLTRTNIVHNLLIAAGIEPNPGPRFKTVPHQDRESTRDSRYRATRDVRLGKRAVASDLTCLHHPSHLDIVSKQLGITSQAVIALDAQGMLCMALDGQISSMDEGCEGEDPARQHSRLRSRELLTEARRCLCPNNPVVPVPVPVAPPVQLPETSAPKDLDEPATPIRACEPVRCPTPEAPSSAIADGPTHKLFVSFLSGDVYRMMVYPQRDLVSVRAEVARLCAVDQDDVELRTEGEIITGPIQQSVGPCGLVSATCATKWLVPVARLAHSSTLTRVQHPPLDGLRLTPEGVKALISEVTGDLTHGLFPFLARCFSQPRVWNYVAADDDLDRRLVTNRGVRAVDCPVVISVVEFLGFTRKQNRELLYSLLALLAVAASAIPGTVFLGPRAGSAILSVSLSCLVVMWVVFGAAAPTRFRFRYCPSMASAVKADSAYDQDPATQAMNIRARLARLGAVRLPDSIAAEVCDNTELVCRVASREDFFAGATQAVGW